MAYKRKRVGRRRQYKRKRNYRRRPRTVGVFAKTAKRNMRYIDTNVLNCGISTIPSALVWSANGIYDPYFTGVGHQPRGFDQIMLFFQHFCVLGAKITARFAWSQDATTRSPTLVGIALKDTTAVETAQIDYLEHPSTSWALLTGDTAGYATVSKTFSARKFFGKRYPRDEYGLKGTAGANPTEGAFFHVFATNMEAGTANPDDINVSIAIQYFSIFSEPKPVASS